MVTVEVNQHPDALNPTLSRIEHARKHNTRRPNRRIKPITRGQVNHALYIFEKHLARRRVGRGADGVKVLPNRRHEFRVPPTMQRHVLNKHTRRRIDAITTHVKLQVLRHPIRMPIRIPLLQPTPPRLHLRKRRRTLQPHTR